MIIREAYKDELSFIRNQRVSSYSEYAPLISEEHWSALKSSISSEADTQQGVELIVAEVAGKIIGSVALFPAEIDAYEGRVQPQNYPEIRMLAVDKEARGKGVASLLVTECVNRTKAKGYSYIGLHTGEFMKDAIKLYTKFGFERLPQHDFVPANDGIVVKAFRLKI